MASEKHAKGEKGQATVGQMRYLVTSTGAFGSGLRTYRCTPVSPLKLKRNTGMSIMNHVPVDPTPHSSTQGALQLTRDDVRVLQYYRALSADDREAVRCLLNALLAPQSQLTSKTTSSATGDARARGKSGQRAPATVRL